MKIGRHVTWLAPTLVVLATAVSSGEQPLPVAVAQAAPAQHSLAGRTAKWPTAEQVQRVLMLRDYNLRIVVLGTTLLGSAAGMVGSFTLLRKRALMSDALSHATLPGIAIAFIVASQWGMVGKSLLLLLVGATASGLLGVATILAIRRLTRLKEDVALGAVLSVFFGAGAALLGVIQQMQSGHAAGLESFIYGKAASLGIADIRLIGWAAVICGAGCLLLFKEFKLLCFDEGFAASRGFPVVGLDLGMMALVVLVTIVGLQAVGLILIIALLIIPAAAARFWTERLGGMFIASSGIGAVSGLLGAMISALFSRLPSGAMIVLVCASMFGVSLVLGPARGLLKRVRHRIRINRTVDRQHLLRALFELLENRAAAVDDGGRDLSIDLEALVPRRSWSRRRLLRAIRRAQRDELVEWVGDRLKLTRRGRIEAARLTRQHRLWELYLIHYADVAPARVDRDADAIEHVLEAEVVAELEALLAREQAAIPASPHQLPGNSSRVAATRTEQSP